jgi:hypothetical protein
VLNLLHDLAINHPLFLLTNLFHVLLSNPLDNL